MVTNTLNEEQIFWVDYWGFEGDIMGVTSQLFYEFKVVQ